jgi:hypothetical protein
MYVYAIRVLVLARVESYEDVWSLKTTKWYKYPYSPSTYKEETWEFKTWKLRSEFSCPDDTSRQENGRWNYLVMRPWNFVRSFVVRTAVHDIWDKNDTRTRSRPIFRRGLWPQPAVCRYVGPAVPVRSPTVPARAGPLQDCHCPYPYPAAVARKYST